MTDLVERLRSYATMSDAAADEHCIPAFALKASDLRTAADEIERLRKTLREIEDSSNDPRAVRQARAALAGGKP